MTKKICVFTGHGTWEAENEKTRIVRHSGVPNIVRTTRVPFQSEFYFYTPFGHYMNDAKGQLAMTLLDTGQVDHLPEPEQIIHSGQGIENITLGPHTTSTVRRPKNDDNFYTLSWPIPLQILLNPKWMAKLVNASHIQILTTRNTTLSEFFKVAPVLFQNRILAWSACRNFALKKADKRNQTGKLYPRDRKGIIKRYFLDNSKTVHWTTKWKNSDGTNKIIDDRFNLKLFIQEHFDVEFAYDCKKGWQTIPEKKAKIVTNNDSDLDSELEFGFDLDALSSDDEDTSNNPKIQTIMHDTKLNKLQRKTDSLNSGELMLLELMDIIISSVTIFGVRKKTPGGMVGGEYNLDGHALKTWVHKHKFKLKDKTQGNWKRNGQKLLIMLDRTGDIFEQPREADFVRL
ncbi:MAG: hypothetical protein GY710_00905 [Desulfobacteraceae bacterium]|nr:hypothetical protein [Desulfobacteraceae bacterium]